MNLDNYRKEFSVFIFNENIHMARLQKESLGSRGYESHFYSSQNLFMQALYLTLPHVVVLPYFAGVQDMILDIRKISKEILIILCGDDANSENILALAERQLVYDYSLNPVKNMAGFLHRVDLAVEKWLISISKEQPAEAPIKEMFNTPSLGFVGETENKPQNAGESLLGELLTQKNDDDAVAFTLKQLAQFTGREFVFFKNDVLNETLKLTATSFGLSSVHQGLGIKYGDIPRSENFWKKPEAHKLWSEFFENIFSMYKTTVFQLKNSEQSIGIVVCLGELSEGDLLISTRFCNALALLLDNFSKSRWIYDYSTIDKQTDCLSNKAFYDKMSLEVSRSRRLKLPLSILSFDIHSKNEIYIQRTALLVAKILKRFTRSTDEVGRIASSRFAVLFPHTPQQPAAQKAGILLGIIKAALEEKSWMDVYVCAGVNEFPDQCDDSLSLLQGCEEAADQAAPFEVLVNQRYSKKHDVSI